MDINAFKASKNFVKQYADHALQSHEARQKKIVNFLNKRSCPDIGWEDHEIESFLFDLAMMDSNNFLGSCGVGEREARIASKIVARRHYYMGHGIGRSGDITEIQPKAAGSSLIGQLSNFMVLDVLKTLGLPSLKKCFIVPLATGMGILLCLRTLHSMRPKARFVVWPRIDQKSCFKCIITAGLEPVIVRNENIDEGLIGSVEEIRRTVEKLGAENIVCILSTVSSFAPKVPDNVIEIAKICKSLDIPHLINNAYGIQCPQYLSSIEQAAKDRVDLFVSSTDKNFMVPVGGSIICGFDSTLVEQVGKMYPGRGSATPSTDLFITLLDLGKNGYLKLLEEREKLFLYLKSELNKITEEVGGKVLLTPGNNISLAFSLTQFESLNRKIFTEVGSMLFSKFVIGSRLVAYGDNKTICGHEFKNWGAHTDENFMGYLTVSATIGVHKEDIDIFIKHFKSVLLKVEKEVNHKVMFGAYKNV